MMNLRQIIELVENNNEINGTSWNGWDDAGDIMYAYVDSSDDSYDNYYCSEGRACEILDRAIESNGKSLAEDIPKLRDEIWGAEAVVIPDTFLTRY